ncbi:hypothetical protein HMPREF3193_01059 [Bifidobacterium breve]|nr:hypothetical protein HMPREF3193_01059 [Bifidobacterium breve]
MTLTDRLIRHPGRLSILHFSVWILLSTGLLMLPISTTNHDGFSNFPVSFFTAVSALSTCGIPVVNTGEYWSMFGQLVILFSIQFGGLGVMTFASIVALGGYSAGVASAGNPACLFILAAAMIVGRGFRNHHRQPVGCRHLRPVGQIGLSEARPHSAAHWRPPYHQCGNRCRQARGSSGGWQLSGLHRNRRPIQRREDSHPAVRGGSQHRGCAGA